MLHESGHSWPGQGCTVGTWERSQVMDATWTLFPVWFLPRHVWTLQEAKPISVIMRNTVLWETGCRIKNVHYRELVLHQGSLPGNDISSGKYCLYHLSLFASLEEVAIVMKCVNVLLFYIFVFVSSTSPSFLACFYISSWQW